VRTIVFHPRAWEDFTYWVTADKKMLRRLLRLIEEAQRTPFEGVGKPEPLRRGASGPGYWARRCGRLAWFHQSESATAMAMRSPPAPANQ